MSVEKLDKKIKREKGREREKETKSTDDQARKLPSRHSFIRRKKGRKPI